MQELYYSINDLDFDYTTYQEAAAELIRLRRAGFHTIFVGRVTKNSLGDWLPRDSVDAFQEALDERLGSYAPQLAKYDVGELHRLMAEAASAWADEVILEPKCFEVTPEESIKIMISDTDGTLGYVITNDGHERTRRGAV